MSSRRGSVVLLQDVLNEAKERALETLKVTKSESLSLVLSFSSCFSSPVILREKEVCRSRETNDLPFWVLALQRPYITETLHCRDLTLQRPYIAETFGRWCHEHSSVTLWLWLFFVVVVIVSFARMFLLCLLLRSTRFSSNFFEPLVLSCSSSSFIYSRTRGSSRRLLMIASVFSAHHSHPHSLHCHQLLYQGLNLSSFFPYDSVCLYQTFLCDILRILTATKIASELFESTADILGISGIIVNDMRGKRSQDYAFEWNKVLRQTGDTGIALQYCHARLCRYHLCHITWGMFHNTYRMILFFFSSDIIQSGRKLWNIRWRSEAIHGRAGQPISCRVNKK